jgi:ketosteroid isomerase-like protein
MESMYYPAATLFSHSAPQSETARLTLARRLRQFAEEKSARSAELGTIEVGIMDDVAVATYPYEFRLTSIEKDGSLVDTSVPFSCATQVFLRDKSGVLRIAHEHFSSAEPGKRKPAGQPSPALAKALLPQPSASGAIVPSAASLPAADSPFAHQIRTAVRELWQHYRSKNRDAIEEMYSRAAIAWSIGAKRGLPVRLVLAAKGREILAPQSSITADLGPIDVHTLSKSVGVASYGFHYCIVRMQGQGKRADTGMPFPGQRYSVDCPQARGTQVFERDEAGTLHIVHEHMSTAGIPIYTELPAMDSEAATIR